MGFSGAFKFANAMVQFGHVQFLQARSGSGKAEDTARAVLGDCGWRRQRRPVDWNCDYRVNRTVGFERDRALNRAGPQSSGGDDLSGEEWSDRDWVARYDVRENLFWLAAEACLSL